MKRFALALGLLSLVSLPAFADSVLYTNGPLSGAFGAYAIDVSTINSEVEDSFTLTSTSTLTALSFGVWTSPMDSLSTVEWGIVSAAQVTSAVAGGGTGYYRTPNTANVDNGPESVSPYYPGVGIATDSISLDGLVLGPGTYYIVLGHAVTDHGGGTFWDENNGPSTAYQIAYGNLARYLDPGETGSESFTIYGTSSDAATPEPSSLILLGSGLAGLAGAIRRKFRA